jgi:hypothetical protein
VARVTGERYQLNLRMLDASSGLRVRTYTKRVVGFEPLLDEMSKAAKILVAFGNKKFGRNSSPQTAAPRVETPKTQTTPSPATEPLPPPSIEEPEAPAPTPPPTVAPAPAVIVYRDPAQNSAVRRYAWIPIAAGGVSLGTGIFFFLGSDAKYRELASVTADNRIPLPEARKIRDAGKSQQAFARIGLSVGTTLLVTGAAMALFSSPGSMEPQVAVGQNHVSLGFAGDLPW